MRTRAHSLPRPLPFFILISFALALVLGALPVEAAPKGEVIKPTVVSLNQIVSPTERAAFLTTFDNVGTSTITDLNLNVVVTGGTLSAAFLPAGCSLPSATTATCPIGDVSSTADPVTHHFEVTASEPTAASGIGPLTLTATFAGDASQNNQQAAKSDTWGPFTASTVVDTSAEVFGGWQNAHGSKAYPAVVGALQTTNVAVPAITNAYAALVRHLDQDIDCGPGPDFEGFGSAVELRVNNGNSPVEVTIAYTDDADAPSPSQVDLIHQLDNGTCVFVVRGCADNSGNPNGCFDAFTVGTGQNRFVQINAELPSNGRIKGG